MNKNNKQVKTILDNYVSGKADVNEIALIETWYNQLPDKEAAPAQQVIEKSSYQAWKQIQRAAEIKQNRKPSMLLAASVIGSMLVAGYAIMRIQNNRPQTENTSFSAIQPLASQVNLTLANGSHFNLESMTTGKTIQEAIASPGIRYNHNNNPFQFIEKPLAKAMVWQQTDLNRIQTFAGGFYQVVLEDGSRIWLNSCSKLLFPSSFKGKKTREITLTGEAYFEVEHNKQQPFIVKTKNQELQVLGTRFNLQAFDNESITKTTLLEGAVKIRFKDKVTDREITLQPGQQSIIAESKQVIASLNTQQEIEWTNGNFSFNDESLHSIIRQLQRWYNIKVDYKNIPNTRYNGTIAKNVSLAKVINLLELTGNIQFKLEKDSLRAIVK